MWSHVSAFTHVGNVNPPRPDANEPQLCQTRGVWPLGQARVKGLGALLKGTP